MQPLIKITTDPIRIMRFSQNARLVSSDSVDMERRRAIARHMSMQRSQAQGSVSVENIAKINRAFSSRSNVTPQVQQDVLKQVSQQAAKISTQAYSHMPPKTASVSVNHAAVPDMESATLAVPSDELSANAASSPAASAASISSPAPQPSPDISLEANSSYAMQRGAFEMRVAKGELTYLPPLMMTIITQRPQVHIEYLGGYNYLPPLDGSSGGSINLFT